MSFVMNALGSFVERKKYARVFLFARVCVCVRLRARARARAIPHERGGV